MDCGDAVGASVGIIDGTLDGEYDGVIAGVSTDIQISYKTQVIQFQTRESNKQRKRIH